MSTLGPPYLNLYDEDPESRFLNLFNTFSNQYPNFGEFIKPDDPELLEYKRLSGEPTGSEALISDYVSNMPRDEEFKPTFGRKMAAFLLGTLSGNPAAASEVARRHIRRPYEEAFDEWKSEGSNISARARLMDAERARQLNALKFGLQTKARTGKDEAASNFRAAAEARRIASEVADEERKKADAEARKTQRDLVNELAQARFDLAKQMAEVSKRNTIEDNTRADAEAKRLSEAGAAKTSSFQEKNKELSAYLSTRGIDMEGLGLTALDAAKRAAYEDAANYGAFKDILKKNPKMLEGYSVDNSKANQYVLDALKAFLQQRTQKYLSGGFK
jgi:hypothetical protein